MRNNESDAVATKWLMIADSLWRLLSMNIIRRKMIRKHSSFMTLIIKASFMTFIDNKYLSSGCLSREIIY